MLNKSLGPPCSSESNKRSSMSSGAFTETIPYNINGRDEGDITQSYLSSTSKDHLTGLLTLDSTVRVLNCILASEVPLDIFVAIGDIDDLTGYMMSGSKKKPDYDGHIAGNACVKIVGKVIKNWWLENIKEWEYLLCGTFGGDEVIIVAVGCSKNVFERDLRVLGDLIKNSAPRPCTFAWTKVSPSSIKNHDSLKIIEITDCFLLRFKQERKIKKSGVAGEIIYMEINDEKNY